LAVWQQIEATNLRPSESILHLMIYLSVYLRSVPELVHRCFRSQSVAADWLTDSFQHTANSQRHQTQPPTPASTTEELPELHSAYIHTSIHLFAVRSTRKYYQSLTHAPTINNAFIAKRKSSVTSVGYNSLQLVRANILTRQNCTQGK